MSSKYDPKDNGDTVSGDEYNNIVNPLANLITSSGQTIDTSNTQVVKAVADYAAVGTFYSDGGVVNAYSLSAIGSRLAPDAYSEGMEIRFRAGNTNTGAATVNVAGLGVKSIKQGDGSTDLTAGDISTDFDTRARYDGTVFRLSNVSDVGNLTVNGKFNTTPATATIASGAITYSSAYMVVDTEGGASSDNLDTINGGVDGDEITINIGDVNRKVSIIDNDASGGNILLKNNINVLLDQTYDAITFKYRAADGFWFEVNRSLTKDFVSSRSINGWQYLPSGMLFQWGNNAVTTGTIVTFPIAFSTAFYTATTSHRGTSNNVTHTYDRSGLTGIKLNHNTGGTSEISWWAVGY